MDVGHDIDPPGAGPDGVGGGDRIAAIWVPVADPGIGAEERGQSEAIARNLLEMAELKVPIICTVIGEGGSGGAIAIAAADRVGLLDREAIRARFELRFSATAMARRYLDVYGDMLAKRPYAEAALNDIVVPLLEKRSFASLV